jgi:pantoate--beta-alanine ligase
MKVTKTVSEIRKFLDNGEKIAFVPTMGALHEGHLDLVKTAKKKAKNVVVSIFVNKTQFNDPKDFTKYPRQLQDDLKKLKKVGATHVFAPNDDEIFSKDFAFKIAPTKLADCLCGAHRNGHFDGVALIITKLFNIVKPDIAIFGEKDFQQLSIIKKLAEDLNFDVEILSHKTKREKSGLAMSSRNQSLSKPNKIKAAEIFEVLSEIKNEVKKDPKNFERILQKKRKKLLESGFEKIDYLEIRDEKNLEIIKNFDKKTKARIFIAVYLGGVRLIDNLSL